MPTRLQTVAFATLLALFGAAAVAQSTGAVRYSSSGSGSDANPGTVATPLPAPSVPRTQPGDVRIYTSRPDSTPQRTGTNIYQSPRTTRNRPPTIVINPGNTLSPAGVSYGITQPPSTLPPDIRDTRYTRNWSYPGVGGPVGNTQLWIDMGTVPANRYYYAPGWGYTNHTWYLGSRSRSYGDRVSYRLLHTSPYRFRSYVACPWYQSYYYPTHPWWDNATWYAPGFPLRFSYRTDAGYWNTYFGYGYGTGIRFGDVDWLYTWYPFGGFVRMVVDDTVPDDYIRYVAPQVYNIR